MTTRESNIIDGADEDYVPTEPDIVDVETQFENEQFATINIRKGDRSIEHLVDWHERGKLITDPEWQRHYVWNNVKASQLIESFLIGLPVPIIYLYMTKDAKYEVIDGVQRITSMVRFINNEFPLTGLVVRKNLERKRFKDLHENMQSRLLDTTIQTYELPTSVPNDTLSVLFRRLNTGGVVLNHMEVRNCVYRGPTMNLIKKLAEKKEFIQSVGINPKNLKRRMEDCSLVLRFLAFYTFNYTSIRTSIGEHLTAFCETTIDAKKADLYERAFMTAIRGSITVFGENCYKVRRPDMNGNAEWRGRANASIFQVITASFANYELHEITERADAIYEEYLDLTSDDDEGRRWIEYVSTNTGDPRHVRFVFDTWTTRLQTVMKFSTQRDSQRVFSRSLKQEMYGQDSTCVLCGQHISLIDDAALDHNKHYWRGGETIPSNARLTHRLCNNRRPN